MQELFAFYRVRKMAEANPRLAVFACGNEGGAGDIAIIPDEVNRYNIGKRCWPLLFFLTGVAGSVLGQEYADSLHSPHALAMRLRNKVPDLVTLPLENDLQFGVGPASATSNTLNFQPVIPFPIGKSWRIVTRTIIPLEYEDPAGEKGAPGKSGVGDINTSWFLSPGYASNEWKWGMGVVLNIPSSSDTLFGYGRWAAGPTLAVVKQKGGLSYDVLLNHQWSLGSRKVSATLVDPSVSYTWMSGFSLDAEAQCTYDWEASQWTVMTRLGGGHVVYLGPFPISLELDGLAYPARGPADPHWGIAVVFTFIQRK